jgi:alpha-1,3-rhamnosyl/mannosyltransferase
MLSRITLVTGGLDHIGRRHDAVFLPNLAVYYRRAKAPLTLTVHDTTSLLYPAFFTSSDRRWHRQVRPVELIRRADRILANSEQTRAEVCKLGAREDRVSVIYLGIGDEYEPASESSIDSVRRKHGIAPGPYFLYLGAVEPRKNVQALVKGFNRARRLGLDATLVIAGPVREEAQLAEAGDGVTVLGWIDAEDKAPLYSGALAAVSLAHHEGFGMLPLEAAACGSHSILKRLPIYNETIGPHATYLESDDEDVVAAALTSQAAAPRHITRADQATLRAQFSWERCAMETLNAIRETATVSTPDDRPS